MPKALEASFTDASSCANADTMICHSNVELVAAIFLTVARTASVGPHETRLSLEKATPMLGDQPLYR